MEIKTTEQIIKEFSRVRLEGEQIIGTILYPQDTKWIKVDEIKKELMSRCLVYPMATCKHNLHELIVELDRS